MDGDGDILTRLQECVSQLNTQFYASLRYISSHHTASSLPGLPVTSAESKQVEAGSRIDHGPNGTITAQTPALGNSALAKDETSSTAIDGEGQNASLIQPHLDPSAILPPEQQPDSPRAFAEAQRELAHDLVLKTRQIDGLLARIPGTDRTFAMQQERLEGLEQELEQVLRDRETCEDLRLEWLHNIEDTICSIRR